MFELKRPYALIVTINKAKDYANALTRKFEAIIRPAQFTDKQYFFNKHDEFFAAHFDPEIHFLEEGQFSQDETQSEVIQRFISNLEFLHESYIHDVVIECEEAIRRDDTLTDDNKESLLKIFHDFRQELLDKLNPTVYFKQQLKENEKDSIINEKFNEAIESLDTETVSSILNCPSLSHQEVLHTLTHEYQRRCTEYCASEFTSQCTREYAFTALYREMFDIISFLIDYICTDLGTAFEERCVKNDAFKELNQVEKRLAKAAIIQCWDDFTQTLDDIREMHGDRLEDMLIRIIYDNTFA